MKKIIFVFLIASAAFCLPACNDASKSGDTSTTTTDSTSSMKMDTSGSGSSMNSASGNSDSSTGNMRMDTSGSKMNSMKPASKDVSEFVMKAATGGMMEVELGNVAQQKGSSQRVKDFGGMMVADHSSANNELQGLASAKSITIPTALMPDQQKHVDMLKTKSGADFDKAYVNMMLEDHKKDIAEFKKASQSLSDADIKSFAGKTLPVLQKHLDSIQAIHHSKM